MNLILLYPDDFVREGLVSLSGRRADHVREVHQADVGRRLRVGILNGRVGEGIITEREGDRLSLEVSLTEDPPPPLPVTLLLAMPRPKCFRRIIQCVTAMGVKRIALFGAYRVEKCYWNSPWLEDDSLRDQMVLGLEQARDTVLPEITRHMRFKPFVEDDLPELTKGSRCWVAQPGMSRTSPAVPGGQVSLAVGPEGGFTDYELELLLAHRFEGVSLGPRILRTEHVVPALLGRWCGSDP